jgi:hypothetical protein
MNTTKTRTQNAGHVYTSNEKGMIFSLDASIAFTILLFGILLFANTLANNVQNAKENIKSIELAEKAIMIADSLVKNYDENNTLLGSCIIDLDKKRVKSNELSVENIRNAKPLKIDDIFVEKIKVQTSTLNETIFLEKKESNECYNIKRFSLINGEKGIIEVRTCRE